MRQKALIDINMLLDTRMGALARLNAEATSVLVRSDWYPLRDTDNWEKATAGVIKNEEYRELYNRYETETLVNSLMTDFVYALRKDIEDIVPEIEITNLTEVIEFDINVYPYKLSIEEKRAIEGALSHYLTYPAKVRVVDIAYHLLTPQALDLNYDMLAIYNYEDWLKYHHETLWDNPMREFTVFYPRIAPSGVMPEPDDVIKDPMSAVPMALMFHIRFCPIPTAFACWNHTVYESLISTPRE